MSFLAYDEEDPVDEYADWGGVDTDGGGKASWGLDPEDQDPEDPDGLGEGDGGDWAGTSRDQRVQQESDQFTPLSKSGAADEWMNEAGWVEDLGEGMTVDGEWVYTDEGAWLFVEPEPEWHDRAEAAADISEGLADLVDGLDDLHEALVDLASRTDADLSEIDTLLHNVEEVAESIQVVADGEPISGVEDDDDDQENDDGEEAEDAAGMASTDVCDDCGAEMEAGATSNFCPVCSS